MSPCQSFIASLRTRGFRITPQREMIIEAFAHQGEHVDAEDVFTQVQAHSHAVNIATVYRTLDLLVEQGLASRIDLGGGRVIYASNQHGSHIHLVCRQCGNIVDADHDLLNSLTNQLRLEYAFTADLQHISLVGLCRACQPVASLLGSKA